MSRKRRQNLIRTLMLSRMVVAVLLVVLGVLEAWVVVAVLYAAAVITDQIDGPIARRWGAQSHRSKRLDGIADVTLTFGGIIALTFGVLPWWVAPATIAAYGGSRWLDRHLKHDALLGLVIATDVVSLLTVWVVQALLLYEAFGWDVVLVLWLEMVVSIPFFFVKLSEIGRRFDADVRRAPRKP